MFPIPGAGQPVREAAASSDLPCLFINTGITGGQCDIVPVVDEKEVRRVHTEPS
jgi:hypothetical protein